MISLKRNQKRCWYALCLGKQPVTDEWGNQTGEYKLTYSNPTELMANIGPASGESEMTTFGSNLQYDKTLVLSDTSVPIDENTVFWIENDTTESYDYIVARVSRSLNVLSVALVRADASN